MMKETNRAKERKVELKLEKRKQRLAEQKFQMQWAMMQAKMGNVPGGGLPGMAAYNLDSDDDDDDSDGD